MRVAVAAVLCVAAGCTGPGEIKAYKDRGDSEVATLVTAWREGEYSATDNVITVVDGVRYEKGGYTAHVLPGVRRFTVAGTLRSRMKPRVP